MTHYVWQDKKISEVWIKNAGKKQVIAAAQKDMNALNKYNEYKTKYLNDITFFNNNKINVNSSMTIYDFFTKKGTL